MRSALNLSVLVLSAFFATLSMAGDVGDRRVPTENPGIPLRDLEEFRRGLEIDPIDLKLRRLIKQFEAEGKRTAHQKQPSVRVFKCEGQQELQDEIDKDVLSVYIQRTFFAETLPEYRQPAKAELKAQKQSLPLELLKKYAGQLKKMGEFDLYKKLEKLRRNSEKKGLPSDKIPSLEEMEKLFPSSESSSMKKVIPGESIRNYSEIRSIDVNKFEQLQRILERRQREEKRPSGSGLSVSVAEEKTQSILEASVDDLSCDLVLSEMQITIDHTAGLREKDEAQSAAIVQDLLSWIEEDDQAKVRESMEQESPSLYPAGSDERHIFTQIYIGSLKQSLGETAQNLHLNQPFGESATKEFIEALNNNMALPHKGEPKKEAPAAPAIPEAPALPKIY